MRYLPECLNLDERDITRRVKPCQAIFAQFVKKADPAGFGERLRQAFDDAGNSEIARKLGAEPSTITNYMKGRIPPPKTLVAIAALTNCSIDWLITGEGDDDQEPYGFLDSNKRDVIQSLAEAAGSTFEVVLSQLVTRGLVARWTDLVPRFQDLPPSEKRELQALAGLIENTVEDAQVEPKGKRSRAG